MECTKNACRSQHVVIKRLDYLVKREARSADVGGIGGVEQKEIVMSLTRWRRTWPAISLEAEVVGSFGEGMIAFQFAHIPRDVIDDPVVETAINGGVIVRHEQGEAFCTGRHIHPV